MLEGSPELLAAFRARRVRLAVLVELEYQLGAVRFWTRRGDLEWNGVTWKGIDGPASANSCLLEVSPIEQSSEGRAAGVTFRLAGVPVVDGDGRSIVRLVEQYARLGGICTIWIVLFDLTTGQIIPTAKGKFTGQLDVPSIEITGATFTVTQAAESHLARLEDSSGLRYNDETQRRFFPGDRGLEFTTRSLHQVDNFG